MNIFLGPQVVFLLFCLVQGCTSAGFLLLGGGKRIGAGWLGFLVLALTAQMLDYFLSASGIYFHHRGLYFSPLFYSFAFGPLLYSYCRVRMADGLFASEKVGTGEGGPVGEGRLSFWHWIPVGVQFVFYCTLGLQSLDTKAWFWMEVHKPITRYMEYYGSLFSMVLYLASILRLSKGSMAKPAWFAPSICALLGFYGLAAIDPLINEHYLPAGAPKFYLAQLALPVIAYALAVGAWLFPQLKSISGSLALPSRPRPQADPGLLKKTMAALDQQRLYTDPDLSLGGLASYLGCSPNQLSATINSGLDQSFSELLNGLRVAEVKRRLEGPEVLQFTILALAFDSGFNSKSAFNRIFKESTGCTPNTYRKRCQPTFRDDMVLDEA